MKNLELESKPKNVEEAIKASWRTAKEMYECAGVCRDTFNEFLSVVRKATSQKSNSGCAIDPTTEKCITGAHNTKYYHPKVEEAFQAWLMKNQANQGRSSKVVKQATMENLEIGAAANYVMSSGSIEAAQQFAQLLISRTEAIAKSKQLEAKNQQLEHALEYDQVKDWSHWNKLKNSWKQYFDMLRHKINYTELFDEVGLVEDKHYKKKVLGFDKFPTVLISPEAEEMLWDWLDSHN